MSLVHRLRLLAQASSDLEDFRARSRELGTPAELEELLGAEFFGLREFFAWARQSGEAPGEEGVRVHPVAEVLRLQCRRLGTELANLAFQHDELVHSGIPALEADYLLKLGPARNRLLELELRNRRLARQVELVQAARNRDQAPCLPEIERLLDQELEVWRCELREARQRLEWARSCLCTPGDPGEAHEVRRLYRRLVRLLHPDLNGTDPDRARLWLQVQEAYGSFDVEGLRLLEALAGSLGGAPRFETATALEVLREERDRLHRQVTALADRIRQLRAGFPCNLEAQLEDPSWVQEQNRATEEALAQQEARRAVLEARLEGLIRG